MKKRPADRSGWSVWLPATAFMLSGLVAGANDWPSFRGPEGSGIGEGDPPVKWNVDTGENILWSVPVEGLALSSPIVFGGRLFLTTAVGEKKEPKFQPDPSFGYDIQREKDVWRWKVICLDKTTGERLWEKTAHAGVPQNGRHSESTHANATPATDGTNVAAMFGSEGLYCYDVDGDLKWKADLGRLGSAPDGHPELEWGYSSSPIIHGDNVILQCDVQGGSFVSVRDLASGKERLRISRADAPTWATPNAHVVHGRSRIVCNGYREAASYDLETGRKIWSFKGRGDVPVPRPIFGAGLTFLTAAHGGRNLIAVRDEAKGDLTPGRSRDPAVPDGVAWASGRQGSYIPTPIAHRGILYVANERGVLAAFEARNGRSLYEERIVAGKGGSYYASPVIAGGKIYVTQNNGDIHALKTGRDFERLATNRMKEPTMATPAISDGRLFVRTRSRLYCIGRN